MHQNAAAFFIKSQKLFAEGAVLLGKTDPTHSIAALNSTYQKSPLPVQKF